MSCPRRQCHFPCPRRRYSHQSPWSNEFHFVPPHSTPPHTRTRHTHATVTLITGTVVDGVRPRRRRSSPPSRPLPAVLYAKARQPVDFTAPQAVATRVTPVSSCTSNPTSALRLYARTDLGRVLLSFFLLSLPLSLSPFLSLSLSLSLFVFLSSISLSCRVHVLTSHSHFVPHCTAP